MAGRHYARRVDGNQLAIVRALRGAGCGVLNLSRQGEGCPDLLVHGPVWPFPLYALEIKNPKVRKGDQRLTDAQVKLHDSWRHPIYIVLWR